MSKTIITNPYPDIELEFDPEEHVFWANGRKVEDSVSRIANMVDGGKSDGLMRYVATVNRDYLLEKLLIGEAITKEVIRKSAWHYIEYRNQKADIGNKVHDWIEKYLKGESWELPEDDNVLSACTGFKKWVNANNVEPIDVEEPVYSKKYDYAGIPDLYAKVNGKVAVLDNKTSSKLYFSTRLQTTGYQIAKEEMTGDKIEERWGLQLDIENGTFMPKLYTEHEKDKESFLQALALKRRKAEVNGRNKTKIKI